jgi:hypothetical protein
MSDKKPNQKRKKGNRTMSQKNENGQGKKLDKNAIKNKKPKIKVLTYELLSFTPTYLILPKIKVLTHELLYFTPTYLILPKIKVLTHELLSFTPIYLILAPW